MASEAHRPTDSMHFCTLSLHTDELTEGTVLYDPDQVPLEDGGLYILAPRVSSTSVQDFSKSTSAASHGRQVNGNGTGKSSVRNRRGSGAASTLKGVPGTLSRDDAEAHADLTKTLVFVAQAFNAEQKRKQRGVQISIHSNAASVYGFRNHMQGVVLSAEEDAHSASHVEVIFRDQYLARSDMWRLTVSELSNRAVYKGQRLLFMGTIKATVKGIYSEGRRVSSAYFCRNSKPIFRSESAKYVIFIQMSREMWDFDAEGSGEIMFNKVINGFLPDLFKRWQRINVRHLVSIILFTRLEYDQGVLVRREEGGQDSISSHRRLGSNKIDHRDYYRVVTTDAASHKWIDILYRLKREFKVFLRDVSVVGGADAYGRPPETLSGVKAQANIESLIAGQPTTAARGNVLEAINLASSQFAKDYIDRDLVRTGLSLVIVTAGTGIFEVDYNMLKLTTDSLVGSGIGVDLVSLARMPLHSVPLFRYRCPHMLPAMLNMPGIRGANYETGSTPRQGSYMDSYAAAATLRAGNKFSHKSSVQGHEPVFGTLFEAGVPWSYALPHWIDCSFWTGHSDEAQLEAQHGLIKAATQAYVGKRKRSFTTSCRMYELQMMGLMENEMSELAIPFLPEQMHESRTRRLFPQDSSLAETGLSESLGSMRSTFLDPHGESPRKSSDDLEHAIDGSTRKELIDWMAKHDKQVFQDQSEPAPKPVLDHSLYGAASLNSEGFVQYGTSPTARYSQSPTRLRNNIGPPPSVQNSSYRSAFRVAASPPKRTILERTEPEEPQARSHSPLIRPKRMPMPRQISLGPRALGTVKGIASTSVSVASVSAENAAGDLSSPSSERSNPIAPPKATAKPSRFSSLTQQLMSSLIRKPSQVSLTRTESSDQTDSDETKSSSDVHRSNPITIKDASSDKDIDNKAGQIMVRDASLPKVSEDIVIKDASVVGRQAGPRSESGSASALEKPDLQKALSPLSAISPWLTMLNPSNPRKNNMNIASQFRRWQHVFPKAIPTSVIKWKSLCSPASLPLTAEYFPTAEQLHSEYQEYIYRLMPLDDEENAEAPRTRETLIREMIACRLSNGFQIVIGPAANEFVGVNAASLVKVFDKHYMAEDGATVLMTIGNNLHQLICTEDGEIEVRRYTRKHNAAIDGPGAASPAVTYRPYIRTYLAHDYETETVEFRNPRPTYNWNSIDHHIAGYSHDLSQELRYFRARFVLIPVAPKIRRGQLGFVSENSDEEIRLEGIQKLTQMWQRYRYIPPEERKFQQSLQQRKKDPNPLAIEYQTTDPSQVVNSHARGQTDPLLQVEPGAHELFSEAEQYHTSDFDMRKIAKHIQEEPPKGIPVADRRWHFRLHHRSFRGDHLTSWLLTNFKDVNTREEAVKLGNDLMERGLFTHAMQKHQFRDGNYFYQIEPEYRAPHSHDASKAGWFTGMGRSIPSTPLREEPRSSPRFGPIDKKWRTGTDESKDSTDSDVSSAASRTPKLGPQIGHQLSRQQSGKPAIELSRMLRYNVDHRNRSWRPEIVNLHYDRIHNPDNAYHIRIEWMNVTAKLIEDAIYQWATTVEKYGLKLVEIPIAEGYALLKQHPFRRLYEIKLAIQPPSKIPRNAYDNYGTQTTPDETFPYHRALLRKFDFVLDLEAASAFDPSVDVTYSWGRPDYRYTQFIHKSGGLLIQISDEGSLLLCANRLCVNRSTSMKEAGKYDSLHVDRGMHERRANNHALASPYASPLIRPTPVMTSDGTARGGQGNRYSQDPDTILEPEVVKEQLEALCYDAAKLQDFFDGCFKPSASASPRSTISWAANTPMLDRDVPPLGLPPNITLNRVSWAGESSGSPKRTLSRRTSTQGFRKAVDERSEADASSPKLKPGR